MATCSYGSDGLTGQRWATSVSRRMAQAIARLSLRLNGHAWRFETRVYVYNVTHNRRGIYSTHRPTTRDQYTAHDAVTASAVMISHDGSRVENHSDAAGCLHAVFLWPIGNDQDAVGHGAISDITRMAWLAGRKQCSRTCLRTSEICVDLHQRWTRHGLQ